MLEKDVYLGPLSGQTFRRPVLWFCPAQWLAENFGSQSIFFVVWSLDERSRQPWRVPGSRYGQLDRFSAGANLLLPMWASSSLGNPLGGTHVLNLAEEPRSAHRGKGGIPCLSPGPHPSFLRARDPYLSTIFRQPWYDCPREVQWPYLQENTPPDAHGDSRGLKPTRGDRSLEAGVPCQPVLSPS